MSKSAQRPSKSAPDTDYDWAQALFDMASCDSTDLPTLVRAAGLDPISGDVSDIDLTGLDLSGQDLSGWDLRYASWKNTKLTGTKLQGAKFDPEELAKAHDWQNAELDAVIQVSEPTLSNDWGEPETEMHPGPLKKYLNKKLGRDGRMSAFSYEWMAKVLRRLGFLTFAQIESCIADSNGDLLSYMAAGTRMGQISRFEHMLLATMGTIYLRRHPWAEKKWFQDQSLEILERFKKHGIKVGHFDPLAKNTWSPRGFRFWHEKVD